MGASSGYLVFAYGRMFSIVRKFMRSKAMTYTRAHGGQVTRDPARKKLAPGAVGAKLGRVEGYLRREAALIRNGPTRQCWAHRAASRRAWFLTHCHRCSE